ncbi:MAG: serine-type D-Ala-D-Ala carboxypeptidase [Legionellaceae bacterium]|nr:serine-type D-Ala-D-Ala carboxypeptidase [Legionellaceae bacterium]
MLKKLSLLLVAICISTITFAAPQPQLLPPAPSLNATAYVLMDANSGKILAQKNMNAQHEPASLTKLMTLYLTFRAIKNGTIKPTDTVLISKKAWHMGGSKMFVKVGDRVPVDLLIQGVIVDSGNDATVALAQDIGGTEQSFVNMMNQQAQALGMTQTHFVDSTGLPDPNHVSTAYDLALLARAIITNFPNDYHYFSQKWLTYNKIKQPNRNRLLWRFTGADGLKTGHTSEAGYCLIASAKNPQGMRLISVVLGTPSDEARASDSMALLRYGFHFFTTKSLYAANTPVTQARIWGGEKKMLNVGVKDPLYFTSTTAQANQVRTTIVLNSPINAPVKKGQAIGKVNVIVNGQTVQTVPLIALEADTKGGIFRRSTDHVEGWFHHSKKPVAKPAAK